jgi:hypothetical protein
MMRNTESILDELTLYQLKIRQNYYLVIKVRRVIFGKGEQLGRA